MKYLHVQREDITYQAGIGITAVNDGKVDSNLMHVSIVICMLISESVCGMGGIQRNVIEIDVTMNRVGNIFHQQHVGALKDGGIQANRIEVDVILNVRRWTTGLSKGDICEGNVIVHIGRRENGFSKGYVPKVNVIVHVGRRVNRLSNGYVPKVNVFMNIRRRTNGLPKGYEVNANVG